MAWLWIIFGLLVIVGSLSWVLPSPRERREAAYRQSAVVHGLKVRMLALDDWARDRMSSGPIAQYGVYTDHGFPAFTLWRVADREAAWTAPPGDGGWRLYEKGLDRVLVDWPDEVIAVGADSGRIWLGFDDGAVGAPDLEVVRRCLDALREWLRHYTGQAPTLS